MQTFGYILSFLSVAGLIIGIAWEQIFWRIVFQNKDVLYKENWYTGERQGERLNQECGEEILDKEWIDGKKSYICVR